MGLAYSTWCIALTDQALCTALVTKNLPKILLDEQPTSKHQGTYYWFLIWDSWTIESDILELEHWAEYMVERGLIEGPAFGAKRISETDSDAYYHTGYGAPWDFDISVVNTFEFPNKPKEE